MALIGRLHPLLVYFPIGLVLTAAVAEVVAMTTGQWDWRAVAAANVRAGAVFAIGAAIAGWRLASSQGVEPTSSLEWHRWLSTLAAVAVFGAALATEGARGRAPFALSVYRIDVQVPKGGDPLTAEFTAPTAGRYEIACSEFCGSGHGRMKAALVSVGPTQTSR